MSRTTITIAALTTLVLGACASGTTEAESTTAPAATEAPTTTAATTTTTLAPTTTTEAPTLQPVYDACITQAKADFPAAIEEFIEGLGSFADGDISVATEMPLASESLAKSTATDGDSITIDGSGFDSYSHIVQGVLPIIMLDCVLAETEAPQQVLDHVHATRALDGQQTDQWGGYEARWSYHPDDGVNFTVWVSS